jgi:(2Fe-2S) ferredoxin
VILLRVGDRSVTARQRFRETAKRLQARLDGTLVLAAYVVPGTVPNELTLSKAVAQVVDGGATEIAIVPYEVEWPTYDVNDNVQDLARDYPHVRLHLAQPLGAADDVVAALANRYAAAWSLPDVASATVDEMVVIAAQPPIAQPTLRPGEVPQLPAHAQHVLVCVGRICQQEGSSEVYDTLTALLEERGLAPAPAMHGLMGRQRKAPGEAETAGGAAAAVKVTRTKCLQPCAAAPVPCIYPRGTFYWNLSPALLPRFVDEVLVGGRDLPDHTFRPGA